jgi:hypothetical protein
MSHAKDIDPFASSLVRGVKVQDVIHTASRRAILRTVLNRVLIFLCAERHDWERRQNIGRYREEVSVPLTFERLGMDSDAMDLREALFHAIFKGGGDVVDLRDGQVALHSAVAGGQDAMLHLAYVDVVAVYKLIVFGGQTIQEFLNGAGELVHLSAAGVGGRDVAPERLDMDVDFDGSVAQFANAVLEIGSLPMGIAEAEILVHLEVQFHEELVLLL